MNTIEDQNESSRKLSTLERSRIKLKFIEMNENPDKFLLNNRYLERILAGKILTGPATKVQKLEAEL